MEFLIQNMQVIIAAVAVLVVLFIVIGVWRAFSPRVTGGRRGQRLGISEYYEVDKQRRLVLVRRDNVEHLVLIGGPQDVLIEPHISSSGQGYSSHPETMQPGTARPAPRAPAFKAPPLRQAAEAPNVRREEPEL